MNGWDVAQTVIGAISLIALTGVWWQFAKAHRFGIETRLEDIATRPDDGMQRIRVTARVEGPMTLYDFEPFVYGDAEFEERPDRMRRADAASEPITFTVKAPRGARASGYGLTGLDYDRWSIRRHALRYEMSEPDQDPDSEEWVLYRMLWLRYAWWRLRLKPKDHFRVGRWVALKPWPYSAGDIPDLFDQ